MTTKRNLFLSIATRAIVSLVVLAAGTAVLAILILTKPGPPERRRDFTLPTVRVVRTDFVEVRRQWSGFGTARAMDAADVPAQVTAIVMPLPTETEAGNAIAAGDVLVPLDPQDFEERLDLVAQQLHDLAAQGEQLDVEDQNAGQRVELAESEVEIAARDLERVKSLYERSDATEVELDQALRALSAAQRVLSNAREQAERIAPRRLSLQAQKQALEAERRLALRNLERTTIRAPISGMIETVDVEQGEQVSPGQRVARIVNLEKIEVPIRLPASARPWIGLGDESILRSTGDADMEWSGRVARIAPVDDEATRTFAVYVEVAQDPEQPALLAPGKYVEGRVISQDEERRMIVPRAAISGDRLFVIRRNTLIQHPVEVAYYVHAEYPQIGLEGEDYWAALEESLEQGSLVVMNGAIHLPVGAAVDPIIVNSASGEISRSGDGTGEAASVVRNGGPPTEDKP